MGAVIVRLLRDGETAMAARFADVHHPDVEHLIRRARHFGWQMQVVPLTVHTNPTPEQLRLEV